MGFGSGSGVSKAASRRSRFALAAADVDAGGFGWCQMTLRVELEREDDGRWLAAVPGVLCYGRSRDDAVAERLERGEVTPRVSAPCPLSRREPLAGDVGAVASSGMIG